jgi:hypothetical protein
MFRTILTGLVIFACASLVAAQSDDYKKFEFFAGYSHNRIDPGFEGSDFIDGREGFNGFNTSVTGNISRYVGFKFDFSGHYKSHSIPFGTISRAVDIDSRIYHYLGGIQVKDNSSEKTFKPFAHALVGAAHARNRVDISNDLCNAISPALCPIDFTETETALAGAFGGGIDIRVSNRIDVRVIQIDYNPTRFFNSTQHNFRFGVGIVFH